jgi:plastocyanin
MTTDGFSPADVTIKSGEAVKFVNATTNGYFWPASNLHPTHELYPEFDPREPIAPGDSWTFVFKRVGEWGYHDHLKANKRGTVKVTE